MAKRQETFGSFTSRVPCNQREGRKDCVSATPHYNFCLHCDR